MKVALIGAGAIGCLLATRLGDAGATVTLLARGTPLDTIRRDGISLITPRNRVLRSFPTVTDDPLEPGPQDVVFLCVKAYALRGVIDSLHPLLGPETSVVPVVNGIPWWYPYSQPAPLADQPLTSVDPGGVLWRTVAPERIIGVATYVAVENHGPGRIRHINDQRFVFGDIAGRNRPQVKQLVDLFGKAGFAARATDRIRDEIWVKLWGNLAFNPLSVLTSATLGTLCNDPGTRGVGRTMMLEAQAVAERLGIQFPITADERIAMAATIGDFKTSMLQDYEAGNRLELEAIIGSVIELAGRVGVDVPTLRSVLALTDLRARTRTYPPGIAA